MELINVSNYEAISSSAATLLQGHIAKKPNMVLGMVTGGTVEGMYNNLVEMYHKNEIDFSQIKTVNTDEYYKIDAADAQSYHYFMQQHFFSKVNINPKNTFLLDGMAEYPEDEALRYEQSIQELGGIDLLVLGMGDNGHLAFCEPNPDYFVTSTGIVDLTQQTLDANSRYFGSIEAMPKQAITIGVKVIMQARKILLMVSGSRKSKTLYRAFNGPITPSVPASILQLHPNLTLLADEPALSLFK